MYYHDAPADDDLTDQPIVVDTHGLRVNLREVIALDCAYPHGVLNTPIDADFWGPLAKAARAQPAVFTWLLARLLAQCWDPQEIQHDDSDQPKEGQREGLNSNLKMGRLCFGLTRTFLIVENFIIVFLASLLIYISFSAMDQDFGINTLNDNHPKVVHTYISAICAGVGIIIALMSILGLFGAMRKSESALAMYTAIIFFMLIVLSILVVVTITMEKNGRPNFYKDLDKSIVNATVHIYNYTNSANDFRTKALDQIQKRLSCCGMNSPNDWKDYGTIRKIPRSCCSNHIETSQPALFRYCEQSEFKIGCWRAMTDYFHSNLSSARTSLYVLIGFSLTCSSASILMIRTLRRRSEVV